MINPQKEYMFQYLISDMDENKQATLNYMNTRSMMIDEMNHRREMEQIKKEIIEEVVARVSIRLEDEALKQLRDTINSIGK